MILALEPHVLVDQQNVAFYFHLGINTCSLIIYLTINFLLIIFTQVLLILVAAIVTLNSHLNFLGF